jgi:hypothetical protein
MVAAPVAERERKRLIFLQAPCERLGAHKAQTLGLLAWGFVFYARMAVHFRPGHSEN